MSNMALGCLWGCLDASLLRLRRWLAFATVLGRPACPVDARAAPPVRFCGAGGGQECLALKLPFLAAPPGCASAPGLRAAVRRGLRRRVRGWTRRGSPHLVGQQNSAPLSLARRAVRAHDATAGRARPTPQTPPLGQHRFRGGRNHSARSWAAPRAALCRRGARARREAASGARPVPRTAPGP